MKSAHQERPGIEPEWEFVNVNVPSPSDTSQMSLEDMLSSPRAAILAECERSESDASYSSNDAAFSPSHPSSWNQTAGRNPGVGVFHTDQYRYHAERQQARTVNPPGPANSHSANGFTASTPLATDFRRFGPRPIVTNASGGRAYAQNDPQFTHMDPCPPYFGFTSAMPDSLLPGVSEENVPSQISPGNAVIYSEPFEFQEAPLGGWTSPDPSISSQSFDSNRIFWPELEINAFGNPLDYGHVPASLPYIDVNDSVSSYLNPIPHPVPSPSSQSDFTPLRETSDTQPFVSNYSGGNDFRNDSYRYVAHQTNDLEQIDSKNPAMPLRPAQKPASSSRPTPSLRQTQVVDDTPVASKTVVFFEEVLTPNNKGRLRRTQERQPQQRVAKRAGGRVLGTHLDQETLQHTNKLRQIGACWICRFQRDKCLDIGGPTCGPCARRQNSTHFQNEHSLGCDRTNIVNYRDDLLPGLMTAHFKQQALEDFAQNNIGYTYRNKTILIQLRFDTDLPCIESETYEFEPKSPKMLQQLQYYRNRQNEWVRDLRACPPLCMVRNPREEVYEGYVDKIVDHKLQKFAATCFLDAPNDFQRRLLELLCSFRPSVDQKELRTVFRLLVTRVLVTRTWSIPEETRDKALSQMQSFRPGAYGRSCSPRMTNKQVKSCFNALHSALLHKMLGSYQEILRKSGGKWVTAFVMVLVLAMATEDCQKMMHATAEENAGLGYYSPEAGERLAVYLAQNQDDKWCHIMSLFRAKFTARGFNPFRDGGLTKLKDKNKIDPEEVRLVQAVHNLMVEKSDFLHGRQHVPIAKANHGQYTSRLVARFLLHFWSDPS